MTQRTHRVARPAPRAGSRLRAAADPRPGRVAILGWSLYAIEAMQRFDRDWLVVGPPGFAQYAEHNHIPFLGWEMKPFDRASAEELGRRLKELGVSVAVPLYEPLVEWAGVVDGVLMDAPELGDWAMLFRNKAMMKRRAQLADIPVGVFREARDRGEVVQFLQHVNEALLADGPIKPVHIKAFDEAGCKGHFVIRSAEDAEKVPDQAFPCLVESDLEGREVACEVFIYDGEIVFMNISEYVKLGHSVFVPPSPPIEAWREELRHMNQLLVEAFEIRHGFIHPEWFLGDDGSIHFGEVAYRVPGGNAFELIERAYGFSAYQGQVLCMDPQTTPEEIEAFFPSETEPLGHAGVLLVYPRIERVSDVHVPPEILNDPAFDGHDLVTPATREVDLPETFVNGTHWGNVYLFSDDPERIRRICTEYESYDFYR